MEINRHKLPGLIVRLATPAILENLSHSFIHLVDALMIAYLGSLYLAAVAVAGVIVWRTIATPACIYAGVVAMVARYYGARDFDKVRIAVAQGIIMALVIGVFVSIGGVYFAHKFMMWMGAEPEVASAGALYLRIIMLFGFLYLFQIVAAGCLRAAGDTKTPMFIMIIINSINIVFSYLFIFGPWIFPRMGIAGAAVGSAIAIILGALLYGYTLFSDVSLIKISWKDLCKIRVDYIKTIIRISIPNGLEEIIRTVGVLAFVKMIAAIGTIALASHVIALRIESVSFMIGFGFSVAATTLVGQSLGQQKTDLARVSFKLTTALAMIIMTVIGFGFFLFPGFFLQFFKPEPDVAAIAVILIRIMALEQPLLAMAMTISGGIRGAGDTLSPMITGLLGIVFVRILLCYTLAFTLNMGIQGIYFGMVIDWAFRAAVIYALYQRGRWTRIAL